MRGKIFLNHNAARSQDPLHHPSRLSEAEQERRSADQGHLCLWLGVIDSYRSGINKPILKSSKKNWVPTSTNGHYMPPLP